MKRIRLASLSHHWLGLSIAAVVIAIAVIVLSWPALVRYVAVARIQSLSHRPAHIDSVHVNPFTGRIVIAGLHILERDGHAPFTDVERVDISLKPLSLLSGHLWIRSAALEGPTVRIVRWPDSFNISDLVEGSGSAARFRDVTVDRFAVTRGTVALEDRALAEPRTWHSQNIEIEAKNLSTQRADGTGSGTSLTEGAPMSISVRNLRLYPIHLEAELTATGFDVSLARLYVPSDAPVTLAQGRVSSTLHVMLDAREGVRASATGEIDGAVLMRPGERDPTAVVPKLTTNIQDVVYRSEAIEVGRLELAGSARIRDPRPGQGNKPMDSTIRASITGLTWPITAPGQLDLESSVPGGGTLRLTGQLRPPPQPSQLRLRLARVDVAPWTSLFSAASGITGIAEADLRVDEPLAPGVPSHIRGSLAVNRVGFRDANRELLGARRIEAGSLRVDWPSRLSVGRVVLDGPRATIERDAAGDFPLRALIESRTAAAPAAETPASATPRSIDVTVGQIDVKDGAVAWRDAMVTPRVALDFSGLDANVTGLTWPLRGPLGIRASVVPPRGGQIQVAGRIAIEPVSANVRVRGVGASLGPYRAYVPVAATVDGRATLDVAVVVPPTSDRQLARVRGSATVSQVDVRDGERTVMRVEQAVANAIDIDWPRRVALGELTLRQPWALFERNRDGALALRELLSPRAPSAQPGAPAPTTPPADSSAAGSGKQSGATVPVTVAQIAVENGGARIVDHYVTPPYAADLGRLTARIENLSTDPASKPAQIALTGRTGRSASLSLQGTVGSLGGPLLLDVNGEVHGFAIPPASPYLIERVAWEARDGWLSTVFRCRIDGEKLDAKTEIRLNRLQVARVGSGDQAKTHIGLPLGMIVALMKDRHGDIRVTLPISGRLSDPRFDMSEAIWSTIRNVAVKAIMAPVSWIGHVELDKGSRIQRIDIDPIPFAAGQAALTPEAQQRVARVAAFLEQAPETRMALTPLVSPRDRQALQQPAIEAEISRLERDGGLSRDAAAAKLFSERFPQRPLPGTQAEMVAALADSAPTAGQALSDLATKRFEVVRDGIRKAGIDSKRLAEVRAADTAASEPGVKLDLVEPEQPAPPGRPNVFRRLLGQSAPESNGSGH